VGLALLVLDFGSDYIISGSRRGIKTSRGRLFHSDLSSVLLWDSLLSVPQWDQLWVHQSVGFIVGAPVGGKVGAVLGVEVGNI